jgi:fumarylpyruvate hydrolase|tara:strand:- start:4616 stop:5302 length:687 start_codon:yes stop_codon:yes gene_type:complete
MSFIFTPHEPPSLAIDRSPARFPIHRIYCVGRNYADHAREMGHDPDEEPPFFFLKPADVIVSDGGSFPFPSQSREVHHEVELVVALLSGGSDIAAGAALQHVFGYAVGIDMTRRDLQNAAKEQGRPWDSGKAFDHSAPCSELHPVAQTGHPSAGRISLTVNDEMRQQADLNQMIWQVAEIIAELSCLFELKAGDLIYTGTPAGVGPVSKGDRMVAAIEDVASLEIRCD